MTVASVDLWNDPRGRDGTCMDEDALKDYLASLEPELYTEKLDEYASGEQRELTVMLETPQGRLSRPPAGSGGSRRAPVGWPGFPHGQLLSANPH